jgi:hypothetical protein
VSKQTSRANRSLDRRETIVSRIISRVDGALRRRHGYRELTALDRWAGTVDAAESDR